MSKERLEEIIKRRRIGYNYNSSSVEIQQLDRDFNWLIEQAERVEELEFRNEITENRNYKLEQIFKDYQQVNKNMYDMTEDLKIKNLKTEQQNKRYREALELIRKDTFYEEHEFVSVRHLIRKRVDKALEGNKK